MKLRIVNGEWWAVKSQIQQCLQLSSLFCLKIQVKCRGFKGVSSKRSGWGLPLRPPVYWMALKFKGLSRPNARPRVTVPRGGMMDCSERVRKSNVDFTAENALREPRTS